MKTILCLMFLVVSAVPLARAAEQVAPASSSGAVDAGNTICPVSGDEVSSKASYVYQGKEYHFCCPECIKKFKKDPEKYISEMEKGGSQGPAGHEHGGMKM